MKRDSTHRHQRLESSQGLTPRYKLRGATWHERGTNTAASSLPWNPDTVINTMDTDDNTIYAHSPKRKRRAPAACTFCRGRKIKCNNEQPRCSNCKIYEKECIYEQKKQRLPEYLLSRRASGDQNGVGVRRQEHRGRVPLPLSPDADREPRADETDSPTAHRSISNSVLSPNGDGPIDSMVETDLPPTEGNTGGRYGVPSTYYGPTSAHFEDASVLGTRRRPDIPPDLVEKVLMAEAAHQRYVNVR